MRLPISWLRDFVDVHEDAQTLADRFAMLGFPVEDIIRRPSITGVVTGKIVDQVKHPNADRLQVCTLDVGASASLTIATAATNTRTGMVVPVATIGAQLPHLRIEPRKMRGVESQGMMCSADELALPPEWFEDGIMALDAGTPLGRDAVELFGLSDDVLDVEVTSNRVDALSIAGLAREIAAWYRRELRLPRAVNPGVTEDPPGEAPRVTLDTPDCTRFVAQVFTGVTIGTAPAWMRIRLALAGQRPINNVVDISNYVMLETAQPLHFYDAARVARRHFIVRPAHAREELTTLDGAVRSLQPGDIVIVDENGPLGLGGLMGGASSEVTEATTSIILESAHFSGARIRRTSMRLGLRTEASTRNEKTLPAALADVGAARAAQLLVAMGATAYAPHGAGSPAPAPQPITLPLRDVPRILGIALEPSLVSDHLQRLGCTVQSAGDGVSVAPPWWRPDLTESVDLVEEVARMEGYDRIEAVVPSVPAHEISSAQYVLENNIADVLAALGYYEIMSYALHGERIFNLLRQAGSPIEEPPVEVRNPLSEDQRYLRASLLPGLIDYFVRTDMPVRAFELGHTFRQEEGRVVESSMLIFGFTAADADVADWSDNGLLRLKGDCEALLRRLTGRNAAASPGTCTCLHPGKTAVMTIDGRRIASLGRVDPRVQHRFGLPLAAYACIVDLQALPEYVVPSYRPPSKFPTTYRDLALVVDLDVAAGAVEGAIREACGDVCTDARVFDEYRGPQTGEGRKSLATRITLGRTDATMTDGEADEAVARALDALAILGARLRA